MSEKVLYIICCVIWAAFAFMFIKYGYLSPQHCDIDKEFLYCHLHPSGALATAGVALLGVSFIFVTGVWKFVTGEVLTNNAARYSVLGFLIGAIGVGLIFAN